jgi:hypothetical protein
MVKFCSLIVPNISLLKVCIQIYVGKFILYLIIFIWISVHIHLNRIFPDLTAVDDKDQESENEEEEPEDDLKTIY